MLAEYERSLAEAREEANRTIAEARAEAQRLMRMKASNERELADRMVAQGRHRGRQEVRGGGHPLERHRTGLRHRRSILQREINLADQARLVEESLKELDTAGNPTRPTPREPVSIMSTANRTIDAVARVYAQSLFELGEAAGGDAKLVEIGEAQGIVEIVRGDAAFAEFLRSPIVEREKRADTLVASSTAR